MNREIRFRAWKTVGTQEMFTDIGNIDFMRNKVCVRYPVSSGAIREDVESLDNLILMQYTGLKDTNGTEIYEGDIVRLQSVDGMDYNAQIVFKDGGFCAIDGTIDNYCMSRYRLSDFDLVVTVLGNIYENPELLEDDEE